MKKILAVLLTLVLVFAVCPMGIFTLTASAVTDGNYTYTVSKGKATITDCNTSISGAITIPSTLGGYPVTSIGYRAFSDCSSLTSITIPDSVTSIGSSAFYNCKNLTSITIPNSVTSIGNYAFEDCSNLTSITIPDSVTSIGSSAFRYCTSLTSITIPNSVTSIGNMAFYGCTGLTSITIPNSVTSIGNYAFSGCTSLTSITIPDSVTSIGSSAFYECTSLTSITIGNSVTSIGDLAFDYCTSLTSITIPDSVTSIGGSAFCNCSNLTSITVNSNNKYYSSENGVLFNKDKTTLIQYPIGETGTNYTIPNSVTSIGGSAFCDCSNLTSITIPDSVTSIGSSAFCDCSNLTSITIPNSVTSIGGYAFLNCTSLTTITIPDSVTSIGDYAFRYCESLTSITIGNSVTSIGNYAFEDCSNLTSITIPNSVTSIGSYAFLNCTSLTSITIPDSVTSIGDYAFDDCDSLTSITIGNSVTSIGNRAFYSCDSLTSITIPDSVTSIGEHAFRYCTSLTSITIPDSVTSIGGYAFSYCSKLTSITIPDSVTSIGNSAFSGCSSLTSITIPDSVTSIGDRAFYNCSSLESITLPFVGSSRTASGTYDAVFGYIFGYTSSSTSGTTLQYYSSSSSYYYYIPSSLNSVTLTDATQIPYGAFYNCKNLTSITIPDSVMSIGYRAFYSCSSLKTVYYYGSAEDWANVSVGSSNQPLLNAEFVFYPKHSKPSAPTIAYEGNGMVVLNSVDGCEYSMDKKTWQSSNMFSGLLPNTEYTFYCRVAESDGMLASRPSDGLKVTTSNFYYKPATPSAPTVQSVTDVTVTLVAVDGHEYSKDGVNWQSSNVFTGLSPVTQYKFYCRIKATNGMVASNNSPALTVTTIKSTPAKPSAPTLDKVTATEIYVLSVDGYEYSLNGSTWQVSGVFTELEPYTTYTIYCRVAETATHSASATSDVLSVTTLKHSVATPNAPTVESVTTNTVTLVAVDGYEYSMNGVNWQSSNVFTGLSPATEYSFYCRVAETGKSYASDTSAETVVTTPKITISAPAKPKLAFEGNGMVILNTASGCEYSCDGVNWQSSNVFEGLKPNTAYTFYCRIPETDTTYSAISEGLIVVTSDFAYSPPSDVNGDYLVTAADAVYLMNHALFGSAQYPVSGNCDFDGDGAVTSDDATYLLYHVLFGESDYPLN